MTLFLRFAAVSAAMLACQLLTLTSAQAQLIKVGRSNYHGRCEIPRAGWNEEALRARDAAVRECKENTVRLGYDRNARVTTEAQDHFRELLERHQAFVRNARTPVP